MARLVYIVYCILFNLLTVWTSANSQMLYGDAEINAGCGDLVFWVQGGYFVPNNFLVEGGHELEYGKRGFPFYICRVHVGQKTYIGKFIKSEVETSSNPSQCWVTDGVHEHVYDNPNTYEVLADYDKEAELLIWDNPTSSFQPPLNAFWAGQAVEGKSMYIGQCSISMWEKETIIPGAVIGTSEDAIMHVAFNRESPECAPTKFLVCKV